MSRIILLCGFTVCLSSLLNADLTLHRKVNWVIYDTVGRKRVLGKREIVYIRDGKIRIDDLTFGKVLIVRSDKRVLWKIDILNQTYSELTFDRIIERRRQIIDEIASTKRHLDDKKELKNIDNILWGLGGLNLDRDIDAEVKEYQQTKQILGYLCSHVKLMLGKRVIIDGWFAKDLREGAQYLASLAEIHGFPCAVSKKLGGLTGCMLQGDLRFILLSERITSSQEVTKIIKGRIPQGKFELPKGLKKVLAKGFEEKPFKPDVRPRPRKDFYEDELDRLANPINPVR